MAGGLVAAGFVATVADPPSTVVGAPSPLWVVVCVGAVAGVGFSVVVVAPAVGLPLQSTPSDGM